MKPRPWLGLGRLILCGGCCLTATIVAGQEPPATTPPIRLSTFASPEAPTAPPTPRRLVPPPSKPLNIPAVDTEHKPASVRNEPLPAEPPPPEPAWSSSQVIRTGLTSESASTSVPPTAPVTAAKAETSPAPHLVQKQAPAAPPGNPYPAPGSQPPATGPSVPPGQAPVSPPPTEPPFAWPMTTPPGGQPPGPPMMNLPFVPANFDWRQLTDFYLRVDGGVHREAGFPERQGIGFEVDARLRLPDAPCFSLLGELRYDAAWDYDDRIAWTFGGVVEQDLLQVVFGVDGIHDMQSQTYVGSGFIMVAQDLPSWHSRVGIWSSVELWSDKQTYVSYAGPYAVLTTRGVQPLEQTSVFYAARLGPNCRWGEAYVAPGFEHDQGHFRLSLGYQGTIIGDLDAFAHYARTFDENDDWSFFAGLQFHFGCGSSRPFDFVMPQRIRAREQWESSSVVVLRNLLP